MMQARRTLKGIARSTNEDSDPVYTERDDAGIGKNTLRESDRARGVLAYTVALRKYALEVCLLWLLPWRIMTMSMCGTGCLRRDVGSRSE